MTQEALKLALEALYFLPALSPAQNELQDAAIEAIKEALREHAMREVQRLGQEPVAWEQFYPDIGKPQLTYPPQGIYYTPPQRTWVGLTDEEIEQMGLSNYIKVVRETEAKLKQKNTHD